MQKAHLIHGVPRDTHVCCACAHHTNRLPVLDVHKFLGSASHAVHQLPLHRAPIAGDHVAREDAIARLSHLLVDLYSLLCNHGIDIASRVLVIQTRVYPDALCWCTRLWCCCRSGCDSSLSAVAAPTMGTARQSLSTQTDAELYNAVYQHCSACVVLYHLPWLTADVAHSSAFSQASSQGVRDWQQLKKAISTRHTCPLAVMQSFKCYVLAAGLSDMPMTEARWHKGASG
jgi:hypothetical protein